MHKNTKNLVLIAMFAALLTGGKLALSSIPNVEIVTLIILSISVVFSLKITLPTVLIFCTMEGLIYGFNTWIISYFIYWPLLAVVGWALRRFSKQFWLFAIVAAIMSTFFGILTSLIDVGLFTGFYENFWKRFSIYYIRGGYFYLAHIISNFIIILFAFKPLVTILQQQKIKYFNEPLQRNIK